MARGLRLASIGFAAIVIANCLFIIVITFRVVDATTSIALFAPHGTSETLLGWVAALFFLLPGIVVVLAGITYPAFAQRLAALRVWWHHRRVYQQLTPLWTELNHAFPQDRLDRVPIRPWRDALSPLGIHRRYYRRVVECRDGLLRLSPYLTNLNARPEDNPVQLARHVRAALRAHSSGQSVSPQAAPVAIPANDTLEADADVLVSLSRAMSTQPSATE